MPGWVENEENVEINILENVIVVQLLFCIILGSLNNGSQASDFISGTGPEIHFMPSQCYDGCRASKILYATEASLVFGS